MSMDDSFSTNELIEEMISNQLHNVPLERRLCYKDISRIANRIDCSIFNDSTCCLWQGYITNINNINKGTYVNFYFKKKKVALHRLLYDNFIERVSSKDYIKFICKNKGRCCNINHMKKYRKNKYLGKSSESSTNNESSNIMSSMSSGCLKLRLD